MFFTAVSVADVGNEMRFSPSLFSMRDSFSAVVGTFGWCLAKQNMVLVNICLKMVK